MEIVEYYKEWGWMDFLIEVAKSGLFTPDGSGLTAIEAAKRANCYDVLMFCSNEKMKAIANKSLYKK